MRTLSNPFSFWRKIRRKQARHFENLANQSFILGLGAQKSGSTWLWTYFNKHPEITVSPLKELHVWDQFIFFLNGYKSPRRAEKRFKRLYETSLTDKRPDNPWMPGGAKHESLVERLQMTKDLNTYLYHFSRISVGGSKFCAEITPEYALLSKDLLIETRDFITATFGSVYPLFIMRDPVDRLWSNLKHDERRRKISSATHDWRRLIKSKESLMRSRYDLTCKNLEEVFPKEKIIYLFYEELFERETLKNLCMRLKIEDFDPGEEFMKSIVKKGLSDPPPEEFLKLSREKLSPVYSYVASHFKEKLPTSWRW